jgi:hypothetical protein
MKAIIYLLMVVLLAIFTAAFIGLGDDFLILFGLCSLFWAGMLTPMLIVNKTKG